MWRRLILCIALVLQPLLVLVAPVQVGATSPNVLIYQLQTGTTSAATQEYISLYNNTADAVDVTGLCVNYASSTDTTQTTLGCVVAVNAQTKLMLPAQGIVTLASNEFVAAHSGFSPDIIFSAGISGTAGHIRLFDANKQEIDRLGYGSAIHPEGTVVAAHANGSILQRIASGDGLKDTDNNAVDFSQKTLITLPSTGLYEEQIPVDVCGNIDGLQISLPTGYLLDATGDCRLDTCLNIDGLQLDVPDNFVQKEDETCEVIPLEVASLVITELLPNTDSYDTGKEFIEIYNPNSRPVNLKGYVLQLAPSFSKSYKLPDQVIEAGAYRAFTDTQTGLVLSNTSAELRLVAPDGSVASTSVVYSSPQENMAWALIGQTWQYTNQPTPGSANLANLDDDDTSEAVEVSSLGACPTGQYRSAETNRCRLLGAAVSALVPCGPNQERNPDTNRCRSVLAASTLLTPCKEGQERNPETNRCRSTASAMNDLKPCSDGEERNLDTNRCRKTASASNSSGNIAKVKDVFSPTLGNGIKWWLAVAAALAAAGYALYEWRHDLVNRWHRRRIAKAKV